MSASRVLLEGQVSTSRDCGRSRSALGDCGGHAVCAGAPNAYCMNCCNTAHGAL